MAEKAKIIPLDMPVGAIEVMFNPNEYTVSFEGKYTGRRTTSNSRLQRHRSSRSPCSTIPMSSARMSARRPGS